MDYAVFKSTRPLCSGEICEGISVVSGQYIVREDKLDEFFALPRIKRALRSGDIVQLTGGIAGVEDILADLAPVPEEPAPVEPRIGIREARRIARYEFRLSSEKLDELAAAQPDWRDADGDWQIPLADLRALLEKPQSEPESVAAAEE